VTKTAATPGTAPASATAVKQHSGPAAYVEVAYIPAHGNSAYVDVEFFKRVRAKYYVLSTVDPTEHVLNALAEAKEQFWTSAEDKVAQVNIIPTYENDLLRSWFKQNEDRLANLHIEIMPPAAYSEVCIDENPDSSCRAYKLDL
jgi:microtubule-associated protein 1